MTPCAQASPSGPIATTCRSCTWPPAPPRPRWSSPSGCCWSRARCPALTRCGIWFGCQWQHAYPCSDRSSSTWPSTIVCWPPHMLEVQPELRAMLRTLHLSGMADNFGDLALKAATAHLTYESYLAEVVQCECVLRAQRRIARLLRQSGLPAEKTFETLQLDRFPLIVQQQVEHVRRGTFIGNAFNIVAVGKPGVGKSHLLAALGRELILQGTAVWWTSTASLVQRLLAAKRDLRLPQELKRLDRYGCLILDDIGYVQHDRDEMEVLFTLL